MPSINPILNLFGSSPIKPLQQHMAKVVECVNDLSISTTHTLVGAVLDVGMARDIGAIDLCVVRTTIVSWVVTLPAGAILATVFFYILKFIFS